MKIEDLLNLTAGELVSEPTITAINSATVYPSKVDSGDLFISNNLEDIKSALARGAYAIIFSDDDIEIIDDEVAWIKVDNIQLSAFKIIRYVLINREASFYLFTPHELSFFRMIITQKRGFEILPNDWRKIFEKILNSKTKMFIGTDEELIKMIKPDVSILNKDASCEIIHDTIFRTTFKIDGYIYQDKEITPFHVDYLKRVVEFCDSEHIPYNIDRVKYTKHFMPIFIDSFLNIIKSNKSDKVAIFVDNLDDIYQAKEYLKYNGAWVKSILLTPPKTKIDLPDKPIWYESIDHAREILKKSYFNYAFVYGLDKSILSTQREDYSLFSI
jgi:ferrochelatase